MKKLVLVLILVFPFSVFASHYMGGEITWQCLNNGRYRFILKLYRECSGVTFGTTEVLNSTSPAGNITMTLFPGGNPRDSADGFLDGRTDLSPACWNYAMGIHCNPSPGIPNTGAIEEWYYTSDAAYPTGVMISGVPPASGWVFSHTGCCRNPCTSITNAGSESWFLRAIMYSNNGQNIYPCYDNSPTFAEVPASVFCSTSPNNLFYNTIDIENDSLVYKWAPVTDSLTYAPGYSYSSPLPGPVQSPSNIAATLNPATGEIAFLSCTNGAFPIVIKITEYRNHIKIAEIFREFQVVIISCPGPNNSPFLNAPFFNPATGFYDLWTDTIKIGNPVVADIDAIDTDSLPNGNPTTVYINAFGEYFGTNFTDPFGGCPDPPCATLNPPPPFSALVALSTNFYWEPDCSQINYWLNNNQYNWVDPYYYFPFYFVFWVNDNYCPVPLYRSQVMNVVLSSGPVLENPILNCAETDSAGNVIIHWIPPVDTTNNFYSYVIYRSLTSSGNYQPIHTVYNINQTTYTDFAINPNSSYMYYYKIKTYSGCNGLFSRTGYSNVVSTTKVSLNITYGNPLMLSWNLLGTVQTSNPWYFIYMGCDGQSWNLIDSTQQMFYFLNNPDSMYEDCQFMVAVIDSNGCAGISPAIFYGIDETELKDKACFDFFPNPASDKLFLKFGSLVRKNEIEIYDVYGRKYDLNISMNNSARTYDIDVSSLSPGIYYLKNPGCVKVEKLLILR